MGSVVIIYDNGSMKEEEGNVLFNNAHLIYGYMLSDI